MTSFEWMIYCLLKKPIRISNIYRCDEHALLIEVDDIGLLQYPHRIAPEAVNGLHVSGRVKLYKMKYYSPNVSLFNFNSMVSPFRMLQNFTFSHLGNCDLAN